MNKYLLLLILFSLPLPASAQEQDGSLLLYNAGFGAITSSLGALFNKPKGTDWKKTVVRAFWQGSIGGVLHYSSKKTLYLINKQEDVAYALPAMLLHAAGNSIIENAAYRRPFLRYWNLEYGPVRFDFSFNEHIPLRARFLPAVLYAVPLSYKYGSPDWKTSALSGSIFFKTADRLGSYNNLTEAAGLSYGRSIVYTTYYGTDAKRIIAHELVHYFQFTEFQIFNTWLVPLTAYKCLRPLKNIFSKYVYFDAPYVLLPYHVEGLQSNEHYYRNFFEFEAERFATNSDIH